MIQKKGKKVLVVEDSQDNALLIRSTLIRQGYRVCLASTSREAMDIIQFSKPDYILCDIMMPKMDGFDLCKHIKNSQEHADIPIVFISACKEKWVIEKAFALGAVDYIAKPFHTHEITNSLSRLVSPYRFS